MDCFLQLCPQNLGGTAHDRRQVHEFLLNDLREAVAFLLLILLFLFKSFLDWSTEEKWLDCVK